MPTISAIQVVVAKISPMWHAGGATDSVEDFEPIEKALGSSLPADYKFVMMEVGEGEGDLPGGYLRLYSLEELPLRQEPSLPGILVFGSDGGDHSFGFDTSSRKETAAYRILEFPSSTLDSRELESAADSLEAFLRQRLRPPG